MNKKILFNFIVLIILFTVSSLMFLFFRLDGEFKNIILSYIRIPAFIKIIVAGSCLSLSGMFLQNISKNPLADPYLTGLSSGAGLFIVLSIIYFNAQSYSLFGFIGAMLSALFVISICGLSKFSITKLILTGLSVNLFVGSVISYLILMNPKKAYIMTLVLTGGVSNVEISNKILLFIFILLMLICACFIPKLNVFRPDSRLIFKSKKEISTYLIIFVILSAFLTSMSVYCAGILGFLGIICPLFCKMLFNQDARILFFANILAGSTLLLFSHTIAANIIYPLVLPLGVVVAICGAPIFIYFLIKKGGII